MEKESAYKYQEGPYPSPRGAIGSWLQKRSFLLTLLFFILFILLSLFFLSSLANVQTISIASNDYIPDQEIIDRLALKQGDSIFDVYWNRHRIEENVRNSHPQIKQVRLDWQIWNDYVLTVEEYEIVAYLNLDGAYHAALENGHLLQTGQAITHTDHPIIEINGANEDNLKALTEQLKQLRPEVLSAISEIILAADQDHTNRIQLFMNDGNTVIASLDQLAQPLNYYPAMVEAVDQQKGQFNIENGAYFKADPDTDGEEVSSLDSSQNQKPAQKASHSQEE